MKLLFKVKPQFQRFKKNSTLNSQSNFIFINTLQFPLKKLKIKGK